MASKMYRSLGGGDRSNPSAVARAPGSSAVVEGGGLRGLSGINLSDVGLPSPTRIDSPTCHVIYRFKIQSLSQCKAV
jgi:hypothetical protein